MFTWLQSRFSRNDLGIDLGTANTLVTSLDGDTLISEPSVVAV
ncbi:MAG: rod shape-determining protein, partial [Planctomycetota bacterium]|nr:rod shape-determining protein [Planctomycetota bacterium]